MKEHYLDEFDHEFSYKKAHKGRRLLAFLLDAVFLSFLSMIIFVLFFGPTIDNPPNVKSFSIIGTSILLYFCRDFWKGKSFGKWALGLKVLSIEEHNTVNPLKLFLRNLSLVIWFVEIFVLLFNKSHQRLGDKLVKTSVYREPQVAKRWVRAAGGIGVYLVLFVSVGFSTLLMMKNSEAYDVALKAIVQDNDIANDVGGIVEFGSWPSGSINITNGYGEAALNIKVVGRDKTRTVFVQLHKRPGGPWKVKKMF